MLECVAVVISLSHITVLLSFLVHANVLWLWGAQSKMNSFLFAFQIKLYIRKQHVSSKPNADGEKNTASPRSRSHLMPECHCIGYKLSKQVWFIVKKEAQTYFTNKTFDI